MKRHYVGHKRGSLHYFAYDGVPTEATHGALYSAVIGPFRTKRAALWAEGHGYMNPHFQHVRDAERFSRI